MTRLLTMTSALLFGAHSLFAMTDPLVLVKVAVANEVRANEHPQDYWMYHLDKVSKSGEQVKEMVETKEGIVARLISVNGHVLTDAERAADDQRLDRLIHDPAEQERKQADQKKELDRFLSLLRALPDALIYADDGTEILNGQQTVRLKFRPNPSFHTTTRETIIFRASEGTLWIDADEKRIMKFDATQTSDINIGLGLLGHIDKGSKLQLEQRRLGEGKWKLSRLLLEGKGQILLFKSITLKQRETADDFRAVPADLSVRDAIDLLKKQSSAVATGRSH